VGIAGCTPTWCALCKITFNGPNCAEMHYGGRKHQAKFLQAQVSIQS
jgi:hypothetical protein